jgi:hypothetical protein
MVNDIFDNSIMCGKCGKKMQKVMINKNQLNKILRLYFKINLINEKYEDKKNKLEEN